MDRKGGIAIALAGCLAGCAVPYRDEPTYRPASLEERTAPAAPAAGAAPPPAGTGSREGAQRAAPPPLTLDACLTLAAENNRRLKVADRRVLIAKDRVYEDYANLIPRFDATGKYQARTNDPGARLGAFEFVMGDRQVGTIGVSAIVPIYTFGRVRHQGEADTLKVDAAELDARRAREDLELSVKEAYFRILEAEKIRSVVDESIAVLQRQLEIARDFHEQGLVAKNDVLAADVQLAQRRQERIQAENNIQLATAALNRAIGRDVDAPTRVADVLEATPWSGTYESVLRAAAARRPDLQAHRREIEIGRAEYRALRSNLYPYLYATGDYNYSSDSLLLNGDWGVGGIVLQFPLFDATNWVKMQRKTREIAQAVDLHDDRLDDIVLQVKQSYLGVREAAERIPVARKSIEEAEENLRMVRDQYVQGLRTSAEVLIEEDRLARARSSYYRSLYDYHDAFARLTNAIAGPPPVEDVKPLPSATS